MVPLVAKKVILMHILGAKNFDDVFPKIFAFEYTNSTSRVQGGLRVNASYILVNGFK